MKPCPGSKQTKSRRGLGRQVQDCCFFLLRYPQDIRLLAREGQTPQNRDRVAVATPARPRHLCWTVSWRGSRGWARPPSKPLSRPLEPAAGNLPTPAASRPRPPQALTSLWSPELAPVERQRMRLRTHSPRSRHAPSGHRGSEPVRRGGGVMGGVIVEGRDGESGAATFREAGYKVWNSRSLAAGVRSGAGGKPLAPLSRDRGQSSSGCLAHGFL